MAKLELKPLVGSIYREKAVGDVEQPVELGVVALEQPFAMAADKLTIVLAGEVALSLFNTPGDKDADERLFGSLIAHEPGFATLKYRVGARGKVTGSIEPSDWGFKLSGEGGITTFSYRRHPADRKLAVALARDASTPRFAFVKDHVLALEPGEAVGLRVGGALALGLKATWSYVFSNAFTALSSLLAAGEILAIDVGPKLTASFDLEVADEFFLAFARAQPNAIDIALRRSRTASQTFGVEFAVEVKLAEDDAFASAVGAALDAVVGGDFGVAKAALTDPNADAESAPIKSLLARLGVETNGTGTLGSLVTKLEERVADAVKKAAEASVKAAFVYEYSRKQTDSLVFAATVRDDALGAHHGRLLRGNVHKLLSASEGSGVTIVELVRRLETTTDDSWGFGLSLGNWAVLEGRDERSYASKRALRWIDGSVREQAGLTAARGYRASMPGSGVSFKAEIAASMEGYSDGPVARAHEADWGLAVMLELAQNRLGAEELEAALDLGELLGAFTPWSRRELTSKLEAELEGARRVRFAFQQKLGERAFLDCLEIIAHGDAERFARMLARAMPFSDDYGRARRDPDARERLYGSVWLEYLRKPHYSPKWLAEAAYSALRFHHPKLAAAEADWDKNPTALAFLGQDNVRRTYRELVSGSARLLAQIKAGHVVGSLVPAAKKVIGVAAQQFWTRAFGALVTDILETTPPHFEGVEVTCKLTFEKDKKRHARVLGAARG